MFQVAVILAFQIFIIVMSVVIHEVAHGLAALKLGDPTAKYAGRLTLNPLKHLDWVGSVFVPVLMLWLVGIPFAWARPVPYNPYNLRNQRFGPALVGLAGPLSNIFLAFVFGFAARMLPLAASAKEALASQFLRGDYEGIAYALSGSLPSIFFLLFMITVVINLFLAFFNLIPIPPLDGSKLLFSLLKLRTETVIMLEQFGFLFLLVVVLFFQGALGIFLFAILSLFLSYVVGI